MKIFFDTEFTGLHQATTLISLGAVSDDNRTFYAEFGDFDSLYVDKWIQENVIDQLRFHPGDKGKGWRNCGTQISKGVTESYGDKQFIKDCFVDWLGNNPIEFWSDCLSYDWVLLCQLFGGALKIPQNFYYIPFDICTVLKVKGIDPDINREALAFPKAEDMKKFRDGLNGIHTGKHNALWDALVIKGCYEKLFPEEAGNRKEDE